MTTGLDVAIVTGAHPSRNPRVVKEATALTRAGWSVRVFHPRLQVAFDVEDAELAAVGGWGRSIYCDLPRGGMRAFAWRVRRRSSAFCVRSFGVGMDGALGYAISAAVGRVADYAPRLVMGHQESGLAAAWRLHRRGFRIGLDVEDWYSRDLSNVARPPAERRLLRELESETLCVSQVALTTSHALARSLEREGCTNGVDVVYNTFPLTAALGQRRDGPLRLVWISQTIGPGRGLEELCDGVRLTGRKVEVTLIGVGDAQFVRSLRKRAGPLADMNVRAPVRNADVGVTLQSHDVGLALEIPFCDNKRLTSSNKLFHYLTAGLPVIASDTDGHREVLEQAPGCGWVVAAGDPHSIAKVVGELSDHRGQVADAAKRTGEGLPNSLRWELQERRLVDAVQRACPRRATQGASEPAMHAASIE